MEGSSLAIAAGTIVGVCVVAIVLAVIEVAAMWKMFTKAGEAGWKAIIPIYNVWVSFKLFWNKNMFWVYLVLAVLIGLFAGLAQASIAALVIYYIVLIAMLVFDIVYLNKMAKCYGKGAGFTVGLLILPVIFLAILGFGSAQYQKIEG